MRADIQGNIIVTESPQRQVEFKNCAPFSITNVSQKLMKQ